MRKAQKSSLARAGIVAAALALFSSALTFAQEASTPKPMRQHIQATAEGTSTQLGRVVSVNITLDEYSTPEDQKALQEAFEQKGQQGLYHALNKIKAKGRISITGTLGYEID